jgi:hypothetical protein
VLLALVVSTGCATTTARHFAQVGLSGAHGVLSTVQDNEATLVCGRPDAPAAPACVPADKHKVISAKLATAFEAEAKALRAIRDIPPTAAPPATIGEAVGLVNTVIREVLALLPDGPVKQRILLLIGGK